MSEMSDVRGFEMKAFMSVMILGLSFAAFADDAQSLEVVTVVQKEEVIVNDDGESEARLVAAETVVPGERVFFTTTFTNRGEDPADNVVITNPIAAELTYVNGSAFAPGMELQFSVDGGATFAGAADLTVTEGEETRPAGPEDYTHIRWVLQNALDTGSQGVARFAAILD